jgi:hypothetical protein
MISERLASKLYSVVAKDDIFTYEVYAARFAFS